MSVDLTTPEAQIATHFMRHKGIHVKPHDVEKLDDQACWYFYYRLPQGVLELEVFFDPMADDWEVQVSTFPVDLD